jgi:ABC-type branched-subunit amino acid transport system substrate-binding protein
MLKKKICVVLLLLMSLMLTACRQEEEALSTAEPDIAPTEVSTESTKKEPEVTPTEVPTELPMPEPTDVPIESPTPEPTTVPTKLPTAEPTEVPEPAIGYMGPIKLAFLGPLTGSEAAKGQEMLGFAKIMVDIFNERTGLEVEVVEGDTEFDAEIGMSVAEEMAGDEEIYVVIGPAGDQVCESTQPVFKNASLAHVTPTCTAAYLTDPGTSTFFRPVPNDAEQSKTVADVIKNRLTAPGDIGVYLIHDQSTYSKNLVDDVMEHFTDQIGRRVGITSVSPDSDLTLIATLAARRFEADLVFFAGQNPDQLSELVIQLRKQGYGKIYFVADSGFEPNWITEAEGSAERTYVTSFLDDPKNVTTMTQINERYAAEYSTDFGIPGGAATLATFVALDAIETCARAGEISRGCVVDALTSMDLANTPMGVPVKFGTGNQAVGGYQLFQVKDGVFVNLKE